ncbi:MULTISPECIES: sensor histidine kinase [Amycolatopsis]|uniref:Histidine kinase n=2 Tax=Amycolatopsis TaxID=1813 RepID=A0A1I4BZP1_9PSEU|nr:CHASE3 domain-containing protein [Amycolatopsis sacchari]SFK74268.1 Histidine kinase [Amycolatopsis sacchari]
MLSRAWPRTLRWRVHALVGGLLLLLLVTAAATTASWLYATSLGAHVRTSLRPAQQAVAALSKDHVDMETGVRGFLLTGDEQFLAPYDSGLADRDRREASLRALLSFDEPSLRLVDEVAAASDAWLDRSIRPAVAAVRAGPVDQQTIRQLSLHGKADFDVLGARLAALQSHIDELTAAGLQQSVGAQNRATVVTGVCAALALVLGAVTVLLLRTSLDAPLRRLLAQVRGVADGDLDQRVDGSGPQEVAELGAAVEGMRVRIRGEIGRAGEAAAQVVRLEETDRIARELGDTVLKNLFGLGLTLQSASARFPVAQPVFTRAIADLDQAINQLRSALYGHLPSPDRPSLGLAVQALVGELESGAGVVPELELSGDLDRELPDEVVTEALEVLHEALGAFVGHDGPVRIGLARTDGYLTLHVSGPAPGTPEGLRTLRERARDQLEIAYEGDRVIIDWEVPA